MKKYTRRAEDSISLVFYVDFYLNKLKGSCKKAIFHAVSKKTLRLQSVWEGLEKNLLSLTKTPAKSLLHKLRLMSQIRALKNRIAESKAALVDWVNVVYTRFVATHK